MPIYNLLGGAEVSHATAQHYKDKVVELLQLDGFILVQTSSDVAMTPDLIFRKPDTEGNTDIFVETKFDDVSLSDKKFLSELATYFILYTANRTEPFDLYLYFRRLKNYSKWNRIFSANLYDEATCQAFFRTLLENKHLDEQSREKVKEKGFDNFKRFIADTYVHQVSYDGLLMRIDARNKGRKNRCFGYDYFLRELPPTRQKQQIIGNFAEIEKYSGSIYSWEIDHATYDDIYSRVQRYEPVFLAGRFVYSLEPIYGTNLKEFIKEKTLKTFNPEEWLLEGYILEGSNKLSILQTLYKKYILNFGVANKGCKYVRYGSADILYFSHADYTKSLTKVNGKQVTRLFKDTSSPFVKHEAIEIEVKIYSQRLFAFFTPIVLFTDNNRELITGRNVKRLHEKFSPNKYDTNSTILGDMKWWFNYLNDRGKTLLETSELLSFVGNLKPPRDSKTRNVLAAQERMEKYFDVQN
jgi:hypothetical protein